MDRKDLKELADNPDLISGIYNYCDRWCERCPFTSRCLVYATEQADRDFDDPETRDINNAKFWKKLGSVLQQAHEMIVEWAEKAGVDLEATDVEATQKRSERRDDAKNDALAIAAREYAAATNDWFTREIGVEVHDDMTADAASDSLDVSAEDAMEVIRWYQYFIAAKVMRAGMREVEEEVADSDQDELKEVLNQAARQDSDGSAKVALIAIDRSMTAWRVLQSSLPDKSASILPLLAALERLRLGTEKTFPDARDFIRPGFDETISEFLS